MSRTIMTSKGTKIVLRNPAEKGKRYARQMKSGVIRETGEILSPTDRAYRAGYLDARNDSAKCYNAQHKFKSKLKSKKEEIIILENGNNSKDNKFSLALSKLKPGVDFIEFKIYYEALKKAYYDAIEYYHKKKGMHYEIAVELANSDFSNDIIAVKNGKISFNSKVPGFRRY